MKVWIASEDGEFLFTAWSKDAAHAEMIRRGWAETRPYNYVRLVRKMDGGYCSYASIHPEIVLGYVPVVESGAAPLVHFEMDEGSEWTAEDLKSLGYPDPNPDDKPYWS